MSTYGRLSLITRESSRAVGAYSGQMATDEALGWREDGGNLSLNRPILCTYGQPCKPNCQRQSFVLHALKLDRMSG